MGTLDNVCVKLFDRQIGMKEGKIVLFVDPKTAFDSVDKIKIIDALRKRGVRE